MHLFQTWRHPLQVPTPHQKDRHHQKVILDELRQTEVNFDRNVLNIKLSEPLGFDLSLSVLLYIPATTGIGC